MAEPTTRPLTDLGNAERFAARHGKNVRYVPAWGKWLAWEENRWRVDDVGAAVQLACETVRSISREEAQQSDDTAERAALAIHAKQSEREPRIRSLLALAQTDRSLVVRPEELDADPYLLGTPNGVLDLRTAAFRDAQRGDLITKLCGARWDPDATAPRWREYLARVLGGSEELQAFMQRAIGYTLTGCTSEQVLFFNHGVGANGKSVLLSVLRDLLGDYATMADFSTFLERRNDGPRTDLARLQGARFVGALEAGENRRLAEGVVKQLTGEDVVTARRLYQAEHEFRPQFKLWLSANHKPIIRGTDYAIWRRIHLVPFGVTIPENERDPHLTDALRAELPGILAWAVQGCMLWHEQGLRPPADVRVATDLYRVESDTIGAFLEECCEVDSRAATPSRALHEAYKGWAEATGEPRLSETMFGRKLGERGFESAKTGHKNLKHRLGIRLLSPSLSVEQSEPSASHENGVDADSCGLFNSPVEELLHARAHEKSPPKPSKPSATVRAGFEEALI